MQLPVAHAHTITSGTPTQHPHKYGLSCAYILLEPMLCVWIYAESKWIFLILSYVAASFEYSVYIFYCCFFFNCRALCWSICVWILNKNPERHLPRGFLFRSIHSPPFLPVFLSYFSFVTLHVTQVISLYFWLLLFLNSKI
jgi:hypothetical protein